MAKKAVLIFDMPETCNQCPLSDEGVEDYCSFDGKIIRDILSQETRPYWCPLIEMTHGDIIRARMYLNRMEYAKEDRL